MDQISSTHIQHLYSIVFEYIFLSIQKYSVLLKILIDYISKILSEYFVKQIADLWGGWPYRSLVILLFLNAFFLR